MVCAVKTLLNKLFLSNWERKAISAILAVIIWLVVNHSLTIPRTLENIAVRVVNIPAGLTVEGMAAGGLLAHKITLPVTGNKAILAELSTADIEIVIDATEKTTDWTASIQKKNLVSLNPEIDLAKVISKVSTYRLPIRMSRLVTEKIPVTVTHPIGDPPHDYQLLDVWPYRLMLTVSGPENIVQRIKANGLSLSFNLNNISKAQLDALHISQQTDEISFAVPDDWKRIVIPSLSDRTFEIDDPQAKFLRIDFVRSDIHPLVKSVPINLFFPQEYSLTLNPETYTLSSGGPVQLLHGIPIIRKALFAKGVSRLFVEVVQDMLELSVIMAPKSEKEALDWCVQFVNPKVLEDRYVSMLLSDSTEDDFGELQPKKREEYLRNRFRNYMNRFQLYKNNDSKLDLHIELKGNAVQVEEEF